MPNEKEKDADHGKTLADWKFPEFIKHKRKFGWYVIVFILIGALMIFAILTSNPLFAILIFLFVIIYFFRTRREPATLEVIINEDGVSIGEKTFYIWKQIKSFWIIYEPPEVKNLYLDFKSGLRPSISISLENQNPLRIRKILSEYLPEDIEKENESFSDGLQRMLKL
ncbi:MAG: hypothetical protein WCV50_03780 [Patescibacteria group bacterium]|jgi:hypothetical protein